MKKGILFILLLFNVGVIMSQIFQPSKQAQGYLENKNTTIDYSTGIFHYNIPLFNLKSGDYELPITLSYSGQGVKPGDLTSSTGKNWSIVGAGVITNLKRAGTHNAEEDIYVLVLNSEKICFILQNDEVVPLEKTNVKITYNKNKDTWLIVDEKGIKYHFDVREITKNGSIEKGVSINNEDHVEYTSSWYPSRISPPNSDPIYFEYSVPYNGKNARLIDSISYFTGVVNMFHYGSPMVEHPMDFQRYKAEFDRYLGIAYDIANQDYLRGRVDAVKYLFDSYTANPLNNTSYDAQIESLKLQKQIMGVITNIQEIWGYSQELFDVLNNIINYFGKSSHASMCIQSAKEVLDNMLRETRLISSRSCPYYSMHTIMPTYLTSIKCGGQEIKLHYNKSFDFASAARILDRMEFHDYNVQKIQTIHFLIDKNLLKKLSWIDKNGFPIKKYDFSYYHEDVNMTTPYGALQLQRDRWGFCSNIESSQQDSVHAYLPDNIYAKSHSLQKITMPEGGELEIDYELNQISVPRSDNRYGGIRLKHLILKDNMKNIDSIKYHYPGSGHLLYDNVITYEKVRYPSGVEDLVIRSRARFTGQAYINTGNNGIMYDYVIEEFKGKGFNSHLFSIPRPSSQQVNYTYPFWLCGLPLAQATYNNNGKLVQLQKMKYYTDLNFYIQNANPSNWLQQGLSDFNYTEILEQTSISEYYIDATTARTQYESYEKTLLYNDPWYGVLYYDPMNAFRSNILPRTGAYDTQDWYNIYYGGKTLLKEQIIYQFTDHSSTSPQKTHLTGNLPSGAFIVAQTEYIYNPVNTIPIGTKNIQSNGDETVTLVKNSNCFTNGTNTNIDKMRDSNYLLPLKQITLVKEAGSTTYTLLSENVIEYIDTIIPLRGNVFLPKTTYTYQGGEAEYHPNQINTLDHSRFSTDSSKYTVDTRVKYKLTGEKYAISDKITIEEKNAFHYGKERNHIILDVSNIPSEYTMATDTYRWNLDHQDLLANVQQLVPLHGQCQQHIEIIDICLYSNFSPPNLNSYIKNNSFQRIGTFLKMIYDRDHFDNIYSLSDSVYNYSIPEFQNSLDTIPDLHHLVPTISFVERFRGITKEEYALLLYYLDHEFEQPSATEEIEVKTDDHYKRFDIVLLLKPTQTSITLNYKIMKGSGSNSRNITLNGLIPGRWQVARATVNAGEISNATSITASIPLRDKGIALALLVPESSIYNATAYNADGNILCRFNQKGEIELHEYDAANRPWRLIDQFGNILKEFEYNTFLSNQ